MVYGIFSYLMQELKTHMQLISNKKEKIKLALHIILVPSQSYIKCLWMSKGFRLLEQKIKYYYVLVGVIHYASLKRCPNFSKTLKKMSFFIKTFYECLFIHKKTFYVCLWIKTHNMTHLNNICYAATQRSRNMRERSQTHQCN